MEKDITISDIAIHAKSKKEVYHVLTVEGGLYLPPIIDANKNYIQNIMRGFKKFLYSKNIKVVKAPHIDKLSIKEIIAWEEKIQTSTLTCPHTVTTSTLIEIDCVMYWTLLHMINFKH